MSEAAAVSMMAENFNCTSKGEAQDVGALAIEFAFIAYWKALLRQRTTASGS